MLFDMQLIFFLNLIRSLKLEWLYIKKFYFLKYPNFLFFKNT